MIFWINFYDLFLELIFGYIGKKKRNLFNSKKYVSMEVYQKFVWGGCIPQYVLRHTNLWKRGIPLILNDLYNAVCFG